MKSWLAGMLLVCGVAAAEPGWNTVRTGHPRFGNSPQSWDAPIHRTRAPITRPPVICPPKGHFPRHHHPSKPRIPDWNDGVIGHIGTGTGLSVNGRWSGDDWRLNVHLGSGLHHNDGCFPINDCRPIDCFPSICYPSRFHRFGFTSVDALFWGYPPVQLGYSAYGYDPRWYSGQTQAAPQPQVPIVVAEPEPKTALEKGRYRLKREEPDLAVKHYQEHLKEFPHDTEVMRELGVALLDAGRIAEGVALIREAYTANPTLADTRIDPALLGPDGDDRLAALVRAVSGFANRNEGASAWLTVTVLMQGQERDRVALANMVKGVKAGLEDAIAQPLGDALRRKAYAVR